MTGTQKPQEKHEGDLTNASPFQDQKTRCARPRAARLTNIANIINDYSRLQCNAGKMQLFLDLTCTDCASDAR